MRWSDLIRSFRGSSTSPQGSPWPNNGEIDMLEGQAGRSCTQTHYGTLQPNDHASGNSASICAPLGYTGWITVSVWRTGEQVRSGTTGRSWARADHQLRCVQRAPGLPVHRAALAGRRVEQRIAVDIGWRAPQSSGFR